MGMNAASLHCRMGLTTVMGHSGTPWSTGAASWRGLLQHNDLLTLGKMSSKIRRGALAGEALREALSECHLEWRAPLPGSFQDRTPKKRRVSEIDDFTRLHCQGRSPPDHYDAQGRTEGLRGV